MRLIDADILQERFAEAYNAAALVMLDYAPTVDPTRHGHWVRHGWWRLGNWPECSECGKENQSETEYCPRCGAKMDEEDPI